MEHEIICLEGQEPANLAFISIGLNMSDVNGDLAEIESQLLDIVAQEGMIDRDGLDKDAVLLDLDIQSADYVMILMAIEEKWGVYLPVDEDLTEAKTVGDLISLVTVKIIQNREKKASA